MFVKVISVVNNYNCNDKIDDNDRNTVKIIINW